MAAVSRRSVMTLYSRPESAYSHRVRLVLAEKGITVEIIDAAEGNAPQDLADLNPYGEAPTLIDRDLVLYDTKVICEYLDERFPHPPLMPVDPVSRAKARLVVSRIERDWLTLLDVLETGGGKAATAARKQLCEGLTASSEVFAAGMSFFLSEDLTMMDVALAPLLWRLPHLGVALPDEAAAVQDYAERLFARDGFQGSLTSVERAMRAA